MAKRKKRGLVSKATRDYECRDGIEDRAMSRRVKINWRSIVRNRIAFRCAVYPRHEESSAHLWHAVY